LGNVRDWHEADVTWARRGIRFQGEGGHDADWLSLSSLTERPFPLTVVQAADEAHFFLSDSNSSSLGSLIAPFAFLRDTSSICSAWRQ
jgi:hypothetical protein